MSESCFTDPKHCPTPEEIQSALGSRLPLWKRLTDFIENSYQIHGAWSTWGPVGSGWNLRYKRNSKSLTALHPQLERVFAVIVLCAAQAKRALQLELGEKISQILLEAPQLRDGRWLFIPVTTESDIEDVESLLQVKVPLPREAT